jgi:hypothetical protein
VSFVDWARNGCVSPGHGLASIHRQDTSLEDLLHLGTTVLGSQPGLSTVFLVRDVLSVGQLAIRV